MTAKTAGVLALSALGAWGLPACTGRDQALMSSPSGTAHVLQTEWVLVELDGQPAGVGAGGAAPTLLLTAEGTRATGFAGCNRFSATFTHASGLLRFGPVATTRMFCTGAMDLESRYVAALEAVRTYRLNGNRLELAAERGVVASFRAP